MKTTQQYSLFFQHLFEQLFSSVFTFSFFRSVNGKWKSWIYACTIGGIEINNLKKSYFCFWWMFSMCKVLHVSWPICSWLLLSANFILALCKVISVFIEFGRIYVDMKKNMWIWKNKNEQENMKRKTTCGYEKTTLVLKKLNLLYGYIEMILLLQCCYYINVVLWIICPIALF